MVTRRQLKAIRDGNIDSISNLMKSGEIDEEVLRTIIESVSEGGFFPTSILAELVVQTKSAELYWQVKPQLFSNLWALLDVFQGEFPDPEIETKLVDDLLEWYEKQDYVRRKAIVDALGQHGSTNAIQVLSELLEEHIPKAQVKTVVSAAMKNANIPMDLDDSPLMARVEIEFVEALSRAIQEIAIRAKSRHLATPPEMEDGGSTTLPPISKDLVDRLTSLKAQAWHYLDRDAKPAMVNARQAAEVIYKALCKQKGFNHPKKPIDNLMAGELLELLRGKRVLPPHIEAIAYTINKLCGLAIHDQGADSVAISARITRPALLCLDELVEWFLRTRGFVDESSLD